MNLRLIVILIGIGAVILAGTFLINRGIIGKGKNTSSVTQVKTSASPTTAKDKQSTGSGEDKDDGGPEKGTFNFLGVIKEVKKINGDTQITIETEKSKFVTSFVITSATKILQRDDQNSVTSSSLDKLVVGQKIEVATVVDDAGKITTASVTLTK